MACFAPIICHADGVTKNGKKRLIFNSKAMQSDPDCFKIPCGKCAGCKMERARQWALRCKHEAQMNNGEGCFVTLTYNEKWVPKQLVKLDLQCFFKRFRKKIKPRKIRFVACGEYGPKLGRPHFHALIFGFDFPDKQLYKTKPFRWYRSAMLEELWPYGFSLSADLTEASACYVARYTMKKVYGQKAKAHYDGKTPEFLTMSLKPGIGQTWYEKYKSDIYPRGVYTKEGGGKVMPPDYYDVLYGRENPAGLEKIKLDRSKNLNNNKAYDVINGKMVKVPNDDSFRLPVRESIMLSKLKTLKRQWEDGTYEH